MTAASENWSEFTENGFRNLLRLLKGAEYRFARFGEVVEGRHVLWRHDVDFSVHRATKLAAIEAEEGAVATYFLNPRSALYNLAESEILRLVETIQSAGHGIGLHFDASAYNTIFWTEDGLAKALAREQRLIEMILDRPVRAVSWHNPDQSNLLDFDADEICGLISAYGRTLRARYAYASDSNGYWRFTPMSNLIRQGHERLHLLTHPEWWTPETLSPAARVDRCIQGRAKATLAAHEALLARAGRCNLGREMPDNKYSL